jgi:hypothetical protein
MYVALRRDEPFTSDISVASEKIERQQQNLCRPASVSRMLGQLAVVALRTGLPPIANRLTANDKPIIKITRSTGLQQQISQKNLDSARAMVELP